MTHANAPFSPVGRRRIAVLIVDGGLPIRRAAERFQCSPATAKRWADRYRAGLPMTDRSSRPHTSPNQLPTKTERRIINLRFNRKWGPHRISYHLRIPRSTVGRVLERYNMPRLCDIDQATGLPVRKPKPKRYEVAAPGELVHIDIKKQGRIPDGGGWRVHGRGSEGHHGAQRNKIQARKTVPVRGYRYLHHAVDDNSRVAYSEILDDEKKETAASFWKRANAFFNDLGITVKAVMTDNGACYRSAAFPRHSVRVSSTSGPSHTDPKPMARSKDSTRPWHRNGLTPGPTPARANALIPTRPGSTTTIITDPTPGSQAKPPHNAFTTSQGSTPRSPGEDPCEESGQTQ